jgi:predicted RNA binding protein YcfA (HicA-like mRNA interferase family)
MPILAKFHFDLNKQLRAGQLISLFPMPTLSTELQKALKMYGWEFYREGGRNSIYTKDGTKMAVPRNKKMHTKAMANILQRIRNVGEQSKRQVGGVLIKD